MTDAESLRLMKESFEHTIVRFVPGMLELFFAGGFLREGAIRALIADYLKGSG